MSAPSYRRRDPQPVSRGWELAAAGIGGVLLAIALAALTGLGLASAVWGRGWVWPHGTDTITRVLGGLLHGEPGRGLPAARRRQVPGPLPVYACVAICELTLLIAAVLTGVLVSRYHRPGDARGGMATRREAQQALGLGQLRGARAIIRPDRYGPAVGNRTRAERPRGRIPTGFEAVCGPSTDLPVIRAATASSAAPWTPATTPTEEAKRNDCPR